MPKGYLLNKEIKERAKPIHLRPMITKITKKTAKIPGEQTSRAITKFKESLSGFGKHIVDVTSDIMSYPWRSVRGADAQLMEEMRQRLKNKNK
uniref:Uncharacterized protein n=1 Tax=viral metagenome TaxID=1070528 RepID=A0A6M3IM45_9ZZZZ